jgi:hypothetical protein
VRIEPLACESIGFNLETLTDHDLIIRPQMPGSETPEPPSAGSRTSGAQMKRARAGTWLENVS